MEIDIVAAGVAAPAVIPEDAVIHVVANAAPAVESAPAGVLVPVIAKCTLLQGCSLDAGHSVPCQSAAGVFQQNARAGRRTARDHQGLRVFSRKERRMKNLGILNQSASAGPAL